jgi:hypothetical protein
VVLIQQPLVQDSLNFYWFHNGKYTKESGL